MKNEINNTKKQYNDLKCVIDKIELKLKTPDLHNNENERDPARIINIHSSNTSNEDSKYQRINNPIYINHHITKTSLKDIDL